MLNLKESVGVNGELIINKYDANHSLIEAHNFKNLVVLIGKQLIAARLFSDTRPAIAINSVSKVSNLATFTFTTPQLSAPYQIGSTITIVDGVSGSYSGTYIVESCTTTYVKCDNVLATGALNASAVIKSLDNGVIDRMAIGTSSIAANIADIALYTQIIIRSIYESTLSLTDGDSSVIYIGQFPATNNGVTTIFQEAGLFNTSGLMMCRTVFTPITKGPTESLEIFWKITIA